MNYMKKVIDMCPAMGITWSDEHGNKYTRGDGITESEARRLEDYFRRYHGQPMDREKAIELAQIAINDEEVPLDWRPKIYTTQKETRLLSELYAFVADDRNGEGVMAMKRGFEWMPLIGADLERVKHLIPIAKKIAEDSKTTFRILLFNNRTDITKDMLERYDNG